MEVEYKMNGVGALSKTGWLNVVALKDNTSSSYIGEFANGKVYQLDLADIKKLWMFLYLLLLLIRIRMQLMLM